jgi:chromosomal replication initiator protein
MPSANLHGPFSVVEPKLTWARFLPLPENRSAHEALRAVADQLVADRAGTTVTLHGPPGAGKTHLVWALVDRIGRVAPDRTAQVIAAGDWDSTSEARAALVDMDVLVLEDLHRLPERAAESVVQVHDRRSVRGRPTVFTAAEGPQRLEGLPGRLIDRLVGGLVVAMAPLGAASRLALVTDLAQRRHLALQPDVLAWLADHLTGTRQLEGALAQLELLSRLQPRPLDVPTVARHFHDSVEADRPTVERIVRRVSGYFQLDPRQLQSSRRHRSVVLPRQVSMYLARQLTDLSLGDIGAHFGGRDHTTVLHACRKVEEALAHDPTLHGAVRQLQADLT